MYIQDINIKDKTVVLRVDYNVPLYEGKVLDDNKIKASLKTINYLLKNNCKIIILSHLGKIKNIDDCQKNSLKVVVPILEKYLGEKIYFSSNDYDDIKNSVKNLNNKDILLIENTRFYDLDNKKESNNDDNLSKFFASLGDIFINDAFATTHRLHASTNGISKYLKTGIGFLIQDEINHLDILLNEKKHPYTIIMGGKKASDKIPVIKNLIDKCDYLLLAGGIANNFLHVLGYNTGKSVVEDNLKEDILSVYNKYKEKIILPDDVVCLNNNDVFNKDISEANSDDIIYDIGNKTILKFTDIIEKSNLIFVNGTCGYYEDNRFEQGTLEIFSKLKGKKDVIVGGGDSAAAVHKFNLDQDIYYISTGGGATLEYLSCGYLKALKGRNK